MNPVPLKQWAIVLAAMSIFGAPLRGQDNRAYLEDFEFLRDIVGKNGAAIKRHDLDWEAICEDAAPRFAAATDDAAHVNNVMRLIATLRDSHTTVTRSTVPWDALPSK